MRTTDEAGLASAATRLRHSATAPMVNARVRAKALVFMGGGGGGLARGDARGFDDVAHVAGGIPQRFERLRFADPIEGAAFQHVVAGRRRPWQRPLPERIAAEILPERRGFPRD